jgi:hypothetical protein
MAYRGKFTPRNPLKYAGDVNNITWRSLWERRFMRFCDDTPGVLKWASEELIIPYISPVDGRPHRYFPDFLIEVASRDGKKIFLVEVKPKKQSQTPKVPTRKTRKYITEVATYAVNQAKWEAAEAYCKQKGWTFLVVTEDHLFKKLNG